MMNICTKYGFNNFNSGSYGGHRRHTTDDGRRTKDDGRRTTPWVWHKLPTGELTSRNVRYSGLNIMSQYRKYTQLRQYLTNLDNIYKEDVHNTKADLLR